MTFREASSHDIPAIVSLLKSSLGETSSPKTVEYWHWKHIHNPFGKSPVMVAEEDTKLVGVRAFMQWKWQVHNTELKGIRAVDTATHPDYQGKGVFKKLTLELIASCKKGGFDFIFNTPNKQSMPGYLKMGWQQLGKIPISIYPVAPHRSLLYKLGQKNYNFESRLIQYCDWPTLQHSWEDEINQILALHYPDKIFPSYPNGFLKWRYSNCPVQRYYLLQEDDFLMVFYPKPQSIGVELRITELWIKGTPNTPHIKSSIKKIAQSIGASYVSASQLPHLVDVLSNVGFFNPRSIGPEMTFRSLENDVFQAKPTIDHWLPLMGTMELF